MDKVKHRSVVSGFSFLAPREFEFTAPHSLEQCERRVQGMSGQWLPDHGAKTRVILVPVGNMKRTKIKLQVATWMRFETELLAYLIQVTNQQTKVTGHTRVSDSTLLYNLFYGILLFAMPLLVVGGFVFSAGDSEFVSLAPIYFFQLLVWGVIGGESLIRTIFARRQLGTFLKERLE